MWLYEITRGRGSQDQSWKRIQKWIHHAGQESRIGYEMVNSAECVKIRRNDCSSFDIKIESMVCLM